MCGLGQNKGSGIRVCGLGRNKGSGIRVCGLGQNKGSGIRGVVLVKIRGWYKGVWSWSK